MADFIVPTMPEEGPHRLLERIQRRLQAVAKVLNHDFPNQLVAVQGLVQLLLEEKDRLSDDGREYLRRLAGASTRALDMTQGLKTLARLATTLERPERITLRELAVETAAEIKKLSPGITIEYDFPMTVEVRANRRPLQQALVELVRLSSSLSGASTMYLGLDRTPAAVEIAIGPGRPRPASPNPAPAIAASQRRIWESRLEYLLAQELVEIGGGTLRIPDHPRRGEMFTILVADTGVSSAEEGAAL
jgi:hypothetical protein